MSNTKISIRFFDDREVRALWDEPNAKWWFSVLDITLDEIVNKYVEMNIAHPFMEGNGRSTRVWLDLILKKRLKKCVDWSKISKQDYMNAMMLSPIKSDFLKVLIEKALSTKINDREMFMKGIDYSYYYEEND